VASARGHLASSPTWNDVNVADACFWEISRGTRPCCDCFCSNALIEFQRRELPIDAEFVPGFPGGAKSSEGCAGNRQPRRRWQMSCGCRVGDHRSLAMKSSTESPTQLRTLATVSTLGQRGLWDGLTRLLLLKEVGSRSAALARPEALRPWALAVRSIARQTLA